ncbi:serine/threonine-protein kinase SMG1-like [Asparagus officinalis]|uniref:serine/threonine-protein kinase SMG1-like n=1 Tax=Asparagus officinalis TaxID=4686 RepID=UPI00098E49E5|nr:serine/threonine-protein kinase SMG1-like [Asparagus officinalis]
MFALIKEETENPVPFHLTQIIETALGLIGIEGSFRANCEAVIEILRKNKNILLMLLEVFVWDPLVEWTRGDNHDEAAIGGEEKKGMELAVSLSLFASRFQEIRIPLQEHRDLLVSTLPAAESALRNFLDVLNQYEIISTIFYHADKEKLSLLQHEASAKSIVAEATAISEKSRVVFEAQAHEFGQAKAVAAKKAQEATIWVDQHGRVLDALRTGSILEGQLFMRLSGMEEVLSLASAVLVSGVPSTVVPEPTQEQCSDIDKEVRRLIIELDNGISSAVETLREYAFSLQRVLPQNYITTKPVNGWAQIMQLSVNNLSGDIFSLARRQAAVLIAKIEDECSEMMRSVGSDIESKSKERLLSAFTEYMQSTEYSSKDDLSIGFSGQQKYKATTDRLRELDMKKNDGFTCTTYGCK